MKCFDLHLMNLKELVSRCYRKTVNNSLFNSNGGLFKFFELMRSWLISLNRPSMLSNMKKLIFRMKTILEVDRILISRRTPITKCYLFIFLLLNLGKSRPQFFLRYFNDFLKFVLEMKLHPIFRSISYLKRKRNWVWKLLEIVKYEFFLQ